VKIEAVDSMTCGVDCFGPIVVRSLVFIKHYTCHVNESMVLSLNHPILLRGIWSQKFMLDALLMKKLFNVSVAEFGAIVTSHLLDR
jgi:hypothetical protein